MSDQDPARRQVRFPQAEQAAKNTQITLVGALVMTVGGCAVGQLGIGVAIGGGPLGVIWLGPLGALVALLGLSVGLPLAIIQRFEAKRAHKRAVLEADSPSHDQPSEADENRWRELLAATTRWDRPNREEPDSPPELPKHEPKQRPAEFPARALRDLKLAKRRASESLWFAVASLLLLPVAFATAPIAIWRGCAANRTFLQFPERAHNYGKATAMAGITLAWVALAFAPFLFIAILW